ncbi:MAG: hypothetical protein O2807_13460 [bacterium]|nr:hypothetical protein [bacterium]
MEISAYRNRGRRPIELPSGLAGFVRAPSVMDLAAYPRLLAQSLEGAAAPPEGEALGEWVHCVLRRCFIPARGAMCDKEPGACGPGELSVHEIEAADAAAILNAVGELSGGNAGEGPAAGGGPIVEDAAFPAGAPEPPRDAPPAGAGLRGAAAPSGGGGA